MIQRNVLEVNSLELKNLIFNDKVIFKHENISKEGISKNISIKLICE